jgi:hypothetical protein
MPHPQHPHCERCKKALFKSPAAAKVKPADPYLFCRNAGCPSYTWRALVGEVGFNPKKPTEAQALRALPALGKPKLAPKAIAAVARANVVLERMGLPSVQKMAEQPLAPIEKKAPPPPKRRRALPAFEVPPKPPGEPEAIAKARSRLRALLAEVAGGKTREEVGLVLAILNQESKNQRAAEVLIDEFELDKKFGLQKFPD